MKIASIHLHSNQFHFAMQQNLVYELYMLLDYLTIIVCSKFETLLQKITKTQILKIKMQITVEF